MTKIIQNKKGITPIISVILLLMMTIAIAGLAYTWLQGVQETIQTTSGNTSERLLSSLNVNLRIEGYTLNCTSGATASNISIYVRNAGTEKANNLRTYVGDELQTDVQSNLSTLGAGVTGTVNLTAINCSSYNNSNRKIKVTSDEMSEETTFSFVCTNTFAACN